MQVHKKPDPQKGGCQSQEEAPTMQKCIEVWERVP